ncbi:hypothetical protein BG005_008575 [Podila minutissima]|nr:hypothetical protein BG005_008575 [Podila minutissima]
MAKYLRPLDPWDRVMLAMHNIKVYNNVQVGARLQLQNASSHPTIKSIPTCKAQWQSLLAGPLAWLVQEHPSLSVVIGDHLSGEPAYWQLPSIDLVQLVHYETIQYATEMCTVIEAKHTLSFDTANQNMPLWRLFVVHILEDDTFFLIFCFHHSIADAGSFVALSEQLVERLNLEATTTTPVSHSVRSGDDLHLVVPSSNKPLPPSLEMRVNCKPGLKTIFSALAPILVPGFIRRFVETQYWAGDFDACAENPHETQVGYVTLSKAETLQALKAAKEHKMTLHALLMAAAAFATKAVLMSSGSDTPNVHTNEVLRTGTVVNLRQLVAPAIDRFDLGNYASDMLHKDLSVEMDTPFWEVAQFYAQELTAKARSPAGVQLLLEFVGLCGLMPRHPGGIEESLCALGRSFQHGRQASLRCSNVGRAWDQKTTPPQGDHQAFFKVLEAVFSQSAPDNSSAMTLNVVTANSRLAIAGTWQKAAIAGRDRGERMVQMMKQVLVDATTSGGGDIVFKDMLLQSTQETKADL